MRRHVLISVVAGTVVLGVVLAGGVAMSDREEELTLEQVPAEVLVTILAVVGDGRILEIVREVHKGRTTYEVEFLLDGREVEIEIAPDGRVLQRTAGDDDDGDDDDDDDGDDDGDDDNDGDDDDDDAQEASLPLGQVPAPVLRTVEEFAGDRDFAVSVEQEHGVTVYEARWQNEGRWFEVEMTADGTLLEFEEFIPEDWVPAAVRRTVEEQFPGATNLTYQKRAVYLYEIEAVVDGRHREVTVLPTGFVLDHD